MVVESQQSQEDLTGGKETNPLFNASRKVLLAGIGVIALAQDEVEDFVSKLVERGEIAEKDGKKLVREVIEKRKTMTQQTEDKMEKRVRDVLNNMNVPTKADIEILGDKIAALSKKIDALKKNQS